MTRHYGLDVGGVVVLLGALVGVVDGSGGGSATGGAVAGVVATVPLEPMRLDDPPELEPR